MAIVADLRVGCDLRLDFTSVDKSTEMSQKSKALYVYLSIYSWREKRGGGEGAA